MVGVISICCKSMSDLSHTACRDSLADNTSTDGNSLESNKMLLDISLGDHKALYDDIDTSNSEVEDLPWMDAWGQWVVFNAGEDKMDPLAQSLAWALQLADISNTWQGDDEPPLHNEHEAGRDNVGAFYCTGKLASAAVKSH
jgi:hypothetical protein